MDLSKLHAITNSYQDVRLLSLRDWKGAQEVSPRDHGGPYAVIQEGYDPADLEMTPDEFVLGKSGEWISTGTLFKLPVDLRRQEFLFGTAAEVVSLLSSLFGSARTVRKEAPLIVADEGEDELALALKNAKPSTTSRHALNLQS